MSTSVRLFHGLPVHDATRPHILKVAKRDLVGGYTRLPNYCVVAHALKRVLGTEAIAHSSKVYVKSAKGDHWVRYEASAALKIEIIVHDRGGSFQEGEYRLNVPPPTSRLGYKPHPHKPKGKGGTLHVRTEKRERAVYRGKE